MAKSSRFSSGTLWDTKESFKDLDKQISGKNTGEISYDEFATAMADIQFPDACLLHDAFHFLDVDLKGVLTVKEVESLKTFDASGFMHALHTLRIEFVNKFGDLATAFEKLDLSQEENITLPEFLNGCKKIKLSKLSKISPKLLYHFLDSMHTCELCKAEWLRLHYFNPPRVAGDSTKDGITNMGNLFGTTNPIDAFTKLQIELNKDRKAMRT